MAIFNIYAHQAIELLSSDKNAILIDVRGADEIETDGKAENVPHPYINITILQEGNIKANFIDLLNKKVKNKSTPLLFLCTAGARSNIAAHLANVDGEYTDCYNIMDGLIGNKMGPGWVEVCNLKYFKTATGVNI